MHIKTRGQQAMLYRSHWVKKGAEGNTHGFSRQSFVGSMPVGATAVPEDLRSRITSEELAFLHARLVAPARDAAEAARLAEEQKKRDPVWRLDEALRLVQEAGALSTAAAVPGGRIKSLSEAIGQVRTVGSVLARSNIRAGDPLGEALRALQAAAKAVHDGHYGCGPEDGVRRTKQYATWKQICDAVDGSAQDGGLLRALQVRGWVKSKGRGE